MHKILVTRELSDQQMELARRLGLNPIAEPAIEIKFRDNWESVVTALKEASEPCFAFTSQNGVEAFSKFLRMGIPVPDTPRMYAVGKKTASALEKIGFSSRVPEIENGTGLAEVITEDLKNHPNREQLTILHFCGNMRRDELRQYLSREDFNVKDLVVYETRLNHMKLPAEQPAAALFFSPSGVQAYRKSGGFEHQNSAHLVAIGTTTAEELSIETGRHVFISPEASVETMLKFTASILRQEENQN